MMDSKVRTKTVCVCERKGFVELGLCKATAGSQPQQLTAKRLWQMWPLSCANSGRLEMNTGFLSPRWMGRNVGNRIYTHICYVRKVAVHQRMSETVCRLKSVHWGGSSAPQIPEQLLNFIACFIPGDDSDATEINSFKTEFKLSLSKADAKIYFCNMKTNLLKVFWQAVFTLNQWGFVA